METKNFQVSQWENNIGPGWYPLIQDLLHKITIILSSYKDVNVSISQLEEWDGSFRLRCDISNASPETEKEIRDTLHTLINQVDDLIFMSCSICGRTRTPQERFSFHYTKTVCSTCQEKMKT